MDSHFELFVTAATTIAATIFLIWGIIARWFRPDSHPLPVFTVVDTLEISSYSCVVCLNDVISGDKCRKLPKCGHVFHVDCVDAWLKCHWTCPLCRIQVTECRPAPKRGDHILFHLLSRADDFIEIRIYDPIYEKLVRIWFGGVVLSHA